MSRAVVIEPEAESKIVNAANWYNQRNPHARDRFLRELQRTLSFIQDNPAQYQLVYGVAPGGPEGLSVFADIYGFGYGGDCDHMSS
jgi:plasmid stabilization system protein ParE